MSEHGLAWAVIPMGGRGTRMYPAAAVIPKALLPVGMKPMFQWVAEEAIAAGIPALVLVVGPEQDLLRDFVEVALRADRIGGEPALADLGRRLAAVEIRWIVQPEPRGISDAFARCREVTGRDRFAVLLPDNWFYADPPAIEQVGRTLDLTGLCTLGLTRVRAADAKLFGNVGGVELEHLGGCSHSVRRLQDKLPGAFEPGARGSALRGCARYALTPEFYDALSATGPPENGEWDDVPAFQRLVAEGRLAAHEIAGVHYDVGLPAGYLAASVFLAGVDGLG